MKLAARLYFWLVTLVLAAPVVVLMAVSVNERKALNFPPQGFSMRWFGELFFDASWRGALFNSMLVAAGAALVALLIATPLAYAVWRYRLKAGTVLYTLGLAPFVLPPVVTALGFLSFWATLDVWGMQYTVILSHGVFLTTLPLVTITLGLHAIDRQLVEAAETMGASERAIATTIVLPLIIPYMISGAAFAFVLSLNEYIIAFMTVGFTYETLPVKIFNSLRYGYTPVMGAAATLFVFFAIIVFGLIGAFGDLPKLLGAQKSRGDA